MIRRSQGFLKRIFDLILSFIGLLFFGWVLLFMAFIAFLETGKNGFFKSERIGKNGKPFYLFKIRTMRNHRGKHSTVTAIDDPRITALGRFWRKTKLDELPQLWNIFRGDMSFVGPRPDVSGFADELQGKDRVILSVRPGLTSPASLVFRHEEKLLAQQADPERYNLDVIWPEKIRLNRDYVNKHSFSKDIRILLKTLIILISASD